MGRMPHGGRSEIGDVKTTLFFNEMRLVIAGIDGMVGVNLGQSGSICSKGFENAYIWPFGQGSEVIHP